MTTRTRKYIPVGERLRRAFRDDPGVMSEANRVLEKKNRTLMPDESPWTIGDVLYVAIHNGLEEMETRVDRKIAARKE